MDTGEQWVDVDDVSAHLKVNKETVRRWIKDRNFPSYRAGNLFRFKLSEVDAWVRAEDCPNEHRSSENPKGKLT